MEPDIPNSPDTQISADEKNVLLTQVKRIQRGSKGSSRVVCIGKIFSEHLGLEKGTEVQQTLTIPRDGSKPYLKIQKLD